MKSLQTKLKEKKGFTLAELLIVVAIIAVLVAVSIPIFTAKLNEAKESTDLANVRAAKAVVANGLLDSASPLANGTYFYNADKGSLVATVGKAGKAYGQSGSAITNSEATGTPEDAYIKIVIASGKIDSIAWAKE